MKWVWIPQGTWNKMLCSHFAVLCGIEPVSRLTLSLFKIVLLSSLSLSLSLVTCQVQYRAGTDLNVNMTIWVYIIWLPLFLSTCACLLCGQSYWQPIQVVFILQADFKVCMNMSVGNLLWNMSYLMLQQLHYWPTYPCLDGILFRQ